MRNTQRVIFIDEYLLDFIVVCSIITLTERKEKGTIFEK